MAADTKLTAYRCPSCGDEMVCSPELDALTADNERLRAESAEAEVRALRERMARAVTILNTTYTVGVYGAIGDALEALRGR